MSRRASSSQTAVLYPRASTVSGWRGGSTLTSGQTSDRSVAASLQVATPTNPSRYLFAYREYTLPGTCNALLTQFLSMFHSLPIRVTSGSYPGLTRIAIRVTGSVVVTRFQRCPQCMVDQHRRTKSCMGVYCGSLRFKWYEATSIS